MGSAPAPPSLSPIRLGMILGLQASVLSSGEAQGTSNPCWYFRRVIPSLLPALPPLPCAPLRGGYKRWHREGWCLTRTLTEARFPAVVGLFSLPHARSPRWFCLLARPLPELVSTERAHPAPFLQIAAEPGLSVSTYVTY